MLAPGTVIGSYRVERVLGSGAMATVYEATGTSLDRRVALKLFTGDLASDPEFPERLRSEVAAQAPFEHPHAVAVYEAGESEHGPFLVTRLVDGPPLAALFEARALDAAGLFPLLGQAADALDAAHAAGLVHGDVSPGNILVEDSERAYLADFGLTGLSGGGDTGPRPLPTPAYLAPEVIAGGPATPASDRYAFAATLFEGFSGEPVFPRPTPTAVLAAHTSEPPPQIGRRRRGLPASLDRILVDALAKDPEARPRSARALTDGVTRCLGTGLIHTLGAPPRHPVVEPATAAVPAPPKPAAPKRPGPGRKRTPGGRKSILVALTLGGVAAAVAGAVVVLSRGERDPVADLVLPAEETARPAAESAPSAAGQGPPADAAATSALRWSGSYASQTRLWRKRARVRVGSYGGRDVSAVLVDWHLRVAVDLYMGGRLLERVEVPDVKPGGRVVDFSRAPGSASDHVLGRVNVSYLSVGAPRAVAHAYQVAVIAGTGPTMTFLR